MLSIFLSYTFLYFNFNFIYKSVDKGLNKDPPYSKKSFSVATKFSFIVGFLGTSSAIVGILG